MTTSPSRPPDPPGIRNEVPAGACKSCSLGPRSRLQLATRTARHTCVRFHHSFSGLATSSPLLLGLSPDSWAEPAARFSGPCRPADKDQTACV